jgi:molecular chaperone DnaK
VLMRVEGFDTDDDVDDEPEPVERPPIDVEPMPIEPPDEARAKGMKIIKLVVAALLIAVGIVITFMTKDHSITGVMDLLK